jgi:hypothetical protein
MSLWVDKYRPTTLDKLTYHKPLADRLKRLVSNVDIRGSAQVPCRDNLFNIT